LKFGREPWISLLGTIQIEKCLQCRKYVTIQPIFLFLSLLDSCYSVNPINGRPLDICFPVIGRAVFAESPPPPLTFLFKYRFAMLSTVFDNVFQVPQKICFIFAKNNKIRTTPKLEFQLRFFFFEASWIHDQDLDT
jgi:hypothetical protein